MNTIALKNVRVHSIIQSGVKTTGKESIWVEDEFNPNGEGGYYLDVDVTLEKPISELKVVLSTDTELEPNCVYMLEAPSIEFISTSNHDLETIDNLECLGEIVFKQETEAALISRLFESEKP